MQFNQDNKIIQLCAKGMELEGQGQLEDAGNCFNDAWNKAVTDFEKCIAAHYVARHQKSIADKLSWDETALKHALSVQEENIKEVLPSFYVNIAKCYEDLNDFDNAKINYETALSFTNFLAGDGYGNMIKTGIMNGLERIKMKSFAEI
ncbi:MAG: rRNA adenine methyltransferase [Agriterribacter sp.]